MKRRRFLSALFALPAVPAALAKSAMEPHRKIIIQRSPVVGFQYHDGEAVREWLRVGQPLQLRREPENARDSRVVRVEWNGRKLGYLPRVENAAVSQMLDRGEPLVARITSLYDSSHPWHRIGLDVTLRV